MNGFINVLKPVGATASDIVVCVKHVLHEKKVGHLGTLDPGASGVLPIAIGQGTKLFNYLTNKKKYYRAFFTFGKTTDTLDSYGEVTDMCTAIPTAEQVLAVLPGFIGEIQQIPPAYSAISVGGVRSYKLARNGEAVELRPRAVTVYDIKLVGQPDESTFIFDIWCSGGTYIRSLARDIAAACGTVGYMSGLIRLKSGCFDIEHAYTLDEIRAQKEACIVNVTYPLSDVQDYVLDDKLFDYLDNGRKIRVDSFDGYRKIYCKGVFFGLGKVDNGYLHLEYYLKNTI